MHRRTCQQHGRHTVRGKSGMLSKHVRPACLVKLSAQSWRSKKPARRAFRVHGWTHGCQRREGACHACTMCRTDRAKSRWRFRTAAPRTAHHGACICHWRRVFLPRWQCTSCKSCWYCPGKSRHRHRHRQEGLHRRHVARRMLHRRCAMLRVDTASCSLEPLNQPAPTRSS